MISANGSVSDFLADVDHPRRACTPRSLNAAAGLCCRISARRRFRNANLNIFLSVFSVNALPSMSSGHGVGQPLLAVLGGCGGTTEDSQEWLSYNGARGALDPFSSRLDW